MSSEAQGLARAGLLLIALGAGSRLLGWLRLVVITSVFGASAELDAYFAAFRIPDALLHLVAGSVLGSVLIPLIAQIGDEDEERAWRLTRSLAAALLAVLGVLTVLAFLVAPLLVSLIAPGFGSAQQGLVAELSRIMLVSPLCFALGAVASSVLHSGNRFLAAALAPLVYNLSIIGAALFLTPVLGIHALAVGVAAGAVGFVLLQVAPLLRHAVLSRLDLGFGDPELWRAIRRLGPRVLGLAGAQLLLISGTALASGLATGAVTAFTLGYTLLQVLVGLLGLPLSVVIFPSLARAAAADGRSEFARLLGSGSRFVAWGATALTVLGVAGASALVASLFGHGQLGEWALWATAATFSLLLLGLPASSLNLLLARGYYALGNTALPVLTTILQVALAVGLAVAALPALGLLGIALGIAAGSWLRVSIMVAVLQLRHAAPVLRDLLAALPTILLAAAAAALAALAGLRMSEEALAPGLLRDVLALGAVGVLGGGAYALVSLLLRSPELQRARRLTGSLLARRGAAG